MLGSQYAAPPEVIMFRRAEWTDLEEAADAFLRLTVAGPLSGPPAGSEGLRISGLREAVGAARK